MSRAPAEQMRPYEYQNTPQHCYCLEDTEGYVGDYSESDALSESQPCHHQPTPPIKEIYRRPPHIPISGQEHVYIPSEHVFRRYFKRCIKKLENGSFTCIEETKIVPVHNILSHPCRRRRSRKRMFYYQPCNQQSNPNAMNLRKPIQTSQYRPTVSIPVERERYERHQEYGDYMYRPSQQQIASVPRSAPPAVPSTVGMRPASRKHPVAVRTPRYYKRSSNAGPYKAPSFLCLPVAYQPDPAVIRRSRRIGHDRFYHNQQGEVFYPTHNKALRRTSVDSPSETMDEMRKFEQPNDLIPPNTKLDNVLTRYESVLSKDLCNADASKIVKISQILKPKVPSSIKEKQEKMSKMRRVSSKEREKIPKTTQLPFCTKNTNTLEVEEVTADILDNLLCKHTEITKKTKKLHKNERSTDKDGLRIESDKEETSSKTVTASKKESDDKSVQCDKRNDDSNFDKNSVVNNKELPKSFNYDEISQNFPKTQSICSKASKDPPKSPKGKELPKKCTSQGDSLSRPSLSLKPSQKSNVVPRILVDDALELHRTKSYVVNLIDQALSNHFNTSLSEKYSAKEGASMDPKTAMEMLKKHSNKQMDKDLCLEIAHALTDSFISTSTVPSINTAVENKQDATCSCGKPDEALYVKLLKQLRWGHLKLIQREIGKLEDLERILDSCSANSFV